MPNLTMYDYREDPVYLVPVGHGLYEKVLHGEDGITRTGNIINLATAIQCGSLFTEEQHQKHIAKKKAATGCHR